jgi:hypothetical protein
MLVGFKRIILPSYYRYLLFEARRRIYCFLRYSLSAGFHSCQANIPGTTLIVAQILARSLSPHRAYFFRLVGMARNKLNFFVFIAQLARSLARSI